ncbi:hypothetical protein [Celeribacter sp.]|uniref:hypothetical protein n=1 Tax=Celeribacter sp. TaxID=1890673 RepID=UPI003A94D3FF
MMAPTMAETRELKLSTPTPEPPIMAKSSHHMAEGFVSEEAGDAVAVFPANKLGD